MQCYDPNVTVCSLQTGKYPVGRTIKALPAMSVTYEHNKLQKMIIKQAKREVGRSGGGVGCVGEEWGGVGEEWGRGGASTPYRESIKWVRVRQVSQLSGPRLPLSSGHCCFNQTN